MCGAYTVGEGLCPECLAERKGLSLSSETPAESTRAESRRNKVSNILEKLRKHAERTRTIWRPDGYGDFEEVRIKGDNMLLELVEQLEHALAIAKGQAREVDISQEVL